jgi:hypothetical protein
VTSRDFVYWLQGFAEIHGGPPDKKQWEVIKNHINLVFVHEIDPSMPDPDGKLQAAHDGKPLRLSADHIDTLLRC